jgi:hypothetical protein
MMQSLLDPAILFFALGVFAGVARSNLEMPAAISKFLSIYLLMALGLKGGFALAASGLSPSVVTSLGLAVLLAVVVPLIGYVLLRRLLSGFDAAALAATYGSVSAVTFVTATQYLESQSIAYGGHMAAAMALMESPAIILAVVLANAQRQRLAATAASGGGDVQPVLALAVPGAGGAFGGTRGAPASAGSAGAPGMSIGKILHESFTDGTQLLLLGAMVIGFVTGDAGKAAMQPFSGDLFKGMLCLFLLDMPGHRTQPAGGAQAVALAAGLCGAGPAAARLPGDGAGLVGPGASGRCCLAGGAGGQRVVHRRAGGRAVRHPRGRTVAVREPVARADVSAQHRAGDTAVHASSAPGLGGLARPGRCRPAWRASHDHCSCLHRIYYNFYSILRLPDKRGGAI